MIKMSSLEVGKWPAAFTFRVGVKPEAKVDLNKLSLREYSFRPEIALDHWREAIR